MESPRKMEVWKEVRRMPAGGRINSRGGKIDAFAHAHRELSRGGVDRGGHRNRGEKKSRRNPAADGGERIYPEEVGWRKMFYQRKAEKGKTTKR